MRLVLMFILVLLTLTGWSQEISGQIIDEKKQPMPAAVVQLFQENQVKGGAAADIDGYYMIQSLDPADTI